MSGLLKRLFNLSVPAERNDDWYRSQLWDEASQTLFWKKLAKARGAYNRGQYVCIQALSLQETKEPKKIRGAVELLNYFLAEWPEHFLTSSALFQLAQCAYLEGRIEDALHSYIQVFQSQRKRPNLMTHAHLEFGWLVISRPCPSFYLLAMDALKEFHQDGPFPVEIFRAATIRALILHRLGRDPKLAYEFAATALAAARMTHSPFRDHPHLGLVNDVDDDIRQELQEILKDSQSYA